MRINTKIDRPWKKAENRHTAEVVKNYHTKQWRTLRKYILTNEPLCRECKRKDIVTEATVVDHIENARNSSMFWRVDNLQPLCNKCHNKKSGSERVYYG